MDTTTSLKMTSLAVQSLFSYVEEENLAAIKAHLDKFRDVDSRSDNGQTPLMVAAEQGNLEIVQELIRRGANVNLDDVDCWTALISAAKEGHIEVVRELLENNANLEHRDMGGWTALMWAAYKGCTDVAELLLEKGANPHITGQYSVYPIIWAAGRGHAEIVHLLLQHGAKVNCSDKYGTTPLIWAARKGHYDSVMHLLAYGADVDHEGANSMTALIVAVKGGYTEVVKELLKRNPNVNMTDKDGNTALAIAAKEGHTEIVQDLLDAGTYVNVPDRSGETMLIGAVRGGHVEIVRALLNKYADIDVRGQDGKTALYWAVEKGNATMVRDILQCNPDTESCTKEGETPLIKATKMRNIEIVELLLDRGAKVSAVDKKGDTPLHIAIRGRSRKLAELLLRNPKDGRLLYRPNKAGETPYNIDCTHQKSILTQIFGAKHLSPSESDGDMLGYDLYSSALADILSEPTMQPPICVGLYAQWGSGKSFLLKKLEDEMKTFAGQQIEPLFQFSWLVVFLTLLLCGSVAVVLGFTVDPKLAIAVSLSLLALLYIFFVLVYFGSRRERESWNWAWVISTRLARQVGYLELLLKLMFVNPPELPEQTTRALPVRFLFTDYNRLSSVGGETSMAEMIATLSDACEREFGFMATRLFRVFKNDEIQGKKWKKTCCVPSFVLFALTLGCLITGMALLAIFKVDPENLTVNAVLIAMTSVVGLALLLNCRTWWQVADSVLNSQRKRLHSAANNLHKLKSEGFMKVLKHEVELMSKMAKTIDGFTQNQTRMAVIIDGLDACEQDKVLQMLDTVRVLFSKGPFISIFASDPHIIIKAINQNLNSVLRDSNINGHDYMRNIVHLPVFLNSRGLSTAKKLCMAAPANGEALPVEGWHEDMERKMSQNSLGQDQAKFGSKNALNRRDTYRRRQMQRTITRQMSFDLTKLLVTEDWFSDISPQTMRRLLNIVSITGRLLRANQIIFNWDRLASWINLTEEWPYRTSWIILFLEETDGVSDQVALKTIYERISKSIPTTKDVEPLLEIDGDIRSFEVFLSSRTPVLTARDVEMFLPCTVNLDPKLREIIADVRAAREQMHMGGVTYPTLPLQEAVPRPQSGYGHHSAACSPAGSFTGSLPPQPHSSYFSGMTGPQHPFYNRVSPAVLLSSMNTDAVCERLKQMDGIDPNMLPHYTSTVKKANINGRVLSQCNLDELKKEMEMNFGDWQLFRGMVMEQRHAESQAVLQDESRAVSEQGSSVHHGEPSRRSGGAQHESGAFSLNLSFEELSGAGLEEPQRHTNNSHWPVANHRTSSMSSLNSQESSNDICKLTDKQQAEYRDAYREYIAQMAQLEMSGSGGERPVQPHPGQFLQAASSEDKGAKEGADQDGRKSFTKRGSKTSDATDFPSGTDGQPLDPISEEDEKLDHSSSSRTPGTRKKGAGAYYHKLPNDEDSGPDEADNTTPLLHREATGGVLSTHRASQPTGLTKPSFLNEILLDKKESSDSGMRSSDSSSDRSSDRSLEEAEGDADRERDALKPSLIELELEGLVKKRGLLPSSLSGLQDATVARMSICSEAPSEASLMASSPDEGWPSSGVSNLNRTASNTTLNNNTSSPSDSTTNTNTNNSHQQQANITGTQSSTSSSGFNDSPAVIITPGSSSTANTTADTIHNQNLRTISLGDERESVL
ncbi:kinase D-interacting substrate of 220 kDa isoform X5 [Seriola lalandi dorsalis]|uniref:Kinase D interacting substrate 220 n=1 Tax=Seriola lalandi dorsalis TaxID=1841481 RepID=A0A3B4WZI7_SERLL|nr:kinase D-interacting substrate of 220 kDa isoform X5 [Seriola lalandi dorsalis]